MNQEDIIRMAREAGIEWQKTITITGKLRVATCGSQSVEKIERFAAIVAAAEREACAKVCDVLAVHPEYASDITKVAAQAIRARGEK